MNGRFLVIGTIVGALVLFVWQTLSNAALPWHEMTMREFGNNDAVVQTIRAAAPSNGMYWSKQGILAAVSMTPDLADRTSMAAMTPMLVRQAAIDLVMALLLALVLLRIPVRAGLAPAFTLGLAGLAAGIVAQGSDWNWYGFGVGYAIVNVVDLTIQFFLAGLVLSMLVRRLAPRTRTQEMAGVPAGGTYPGYGSGRGAAAR